MNHVKYYSHRLCRLAARRCSDPMSAIDLTSPRAVVVNLGGQRPTSRSRRKHFGAQDVQAEGLAGPVNTLAPAGPSAGVPARSGRRTRQRAGVEVPDLVDAFRELSAV